MTGCSRSCPIARASYETCNVRRGAPQRTGWLRHRARRLEKNSLHKTKDAQMPTDDKPEHPEMGEDPLKSLILLTMPWLCFQRDMLEVAKKSVLDASSVKPAAKFAFHELHALRMVLDPLNMMQDRC